MSSKAAAGRATKALLVNTLRLVLGKAALSAEEKTKFYYLKRHKYIIQKDSGYVATPKGQQLLAEEAVWSLTITTPRTWDRKWRLVLFDIPKDRRKRRDSFRLRLKELGLVRYQNSVWVYPYPLEIEVRHIEQFYKLHGCISLITAESLSGERGLLTHFRLKK